MPINLSMGYHVNTGLALVEWRHPHPQRLDQAILVVRGTPTLSFVCACLFQCSRLSVYLANTSGNYC